jgi:hypothetical protein
MRRANAASLPSIASPIAVAASLADLTAAALIKYRSFMVCPALSPSLEGGSDAAEEYTASHYEASYTIASGLTAVLTVSDFDYENGTSADASTVDESGTITTLNIKASF